MLYLSIHFSLGPICLSASLVSVNRSTSQSYVVHDAITITNDGELAAVANSGTGTANDPYIIAGWNITGSPTHGISVNGTIKYFKIENCWIGSSNFHGIYVDSIASGTATIIKGTCNNNGENGISLVHSGSSTITNNTCFDNGGRGISLEDSGSSTVANNICNSNHYGIRLEHSGSSTIANNTCNDNDRGIRLFDSDFSTIANNICNDNGGRGIRLEDSGSSTVTNNICNNNLYAGISLYVSGSSSVANNTCNNNRDVGISLEFSGSSIVVANNSCINNDFGIRIEFSFNDLIVWNMLVGNGAYGIELSGDSDINVIHHNDFVANGQNTSQAYDNGTDNQWYEETTMEGNYWSDYNGTGSYLIAGSAGTSDPYPSLSPYRYTDKIDTSSSPSPVFPQEFLAIIGLFVVVIGLSVVVLFVNKRQKSA